MPFTEDVSRRCRADFPALAREVDGRPLAYLDGPAGTQVPRQVIDAVSRYYATCNANTHGAFVTSRESDAMVHAAREAAAALLGAASWREISFGANMTTLAFVLSHALARRMQPGDEIVVTQLDHEANRGPWLHLEERGFRVREIPLRRDGTLELDRLEEAITPRTRLVAAGLASNALGTVHDLAPLREAARAAGALFLVDAVHYAPHFSLDVTALDADFLLCSAYKFYAPHVGILYSRPGLLDSLTTDRLRTTDPAAPYRIETGTLNHAAIAGVLAGIEYLASLGEGATLRERLVSAFAGISAHEWNLARAYYEGVRAIPGVTVWGPDFSTARRAPTVSVTFAGRRADAVAEQLAARGIAVWAGDFYAARAMEVLGLAEGGGVLRTGFVLYNQRDEVDRLLAELNQLAG